MDLNTQPATEATPGPEIAPLTAAQVYEKLGALLREKPAAGEKPFYMVGNDFSFSAWAIELGLDSTNADVVWLSTDVPDNKTNRGNMIIGSVGGTVRQVNFGGAKTVNINGKDFHGSLVEHREGRTFVDGRDVTDELEPVAGLVIMRKDDSENTEAGAVEKRSVGGGFMKIGSNIITGLVGGWGRRRR